MSKIIQERLKISDVIIPKVFENRPPSLDKIITRQEYFKNNGCQEKPIVVSPKNILSDGYATYLALQQLGEEEISCIRTNTSGIHRRDYRYNPTLYVYGVHSHKSGYKSKEYVWRVPNGSKQQFLQTVLPGNKIVVATKDGKKVVTVTRFEELDKPPIEGRISKYICKYKTRKNNE